MIQSSQSYGCPVECKYCVITQVDARKEQWDNRTILGLNKAVTILNPPPDLDDKNAVKEFYDFPIDLLRGDYVGFNAISDPFWPKYQKELDFFLTQVPPVAKLVTCVTKFNPSDTVLRRLSEIPNFRLVVSITGLNSIEKTKTNHRLDLLKRSKQFGVQAFPIIHPYIEGMSDLSFLPKLKELGYDAVDVKGLRYNQRMNNWMPEISQEYYRESNEKEFLPETRWRELLADAELTQVSLKDWYGKESLQPKLSLFEATWRVREIVRRANITSSDTDDAVVEAAVKRRM